MMFNKHEFSQTNQKGFTLHFLFQHSAHIYLNSLGALFISLHGLLQQCHHIQET